MKRTMKRDYFRWQSFYAVLGVQNPGW